MVDVVEENFNIRAYEHSAFQLVERLNESNSPTLSHSSWDVVSSCISGDVSDFHCLKCKIKSFIKAHPSIVSEIEKYFSNELMDHILKRAFRVEFTVEDSVKTNLLYQRFFLEQDANIRIIADYFLDDIKELMLIGKFERIPWSLRQAIIYTPKSVLLKLTITWLNFKGAETFTTMLYKNLLNPVEESSSNISFDQRNLYLFLIIFFFLLFAINIQIIGAMVNCLAGIFLIAFVLYYSLTYFKRFNK